MRGWLPSSRFQGTGTAPVTPSLPWHATTPDRVEFVQPDKAMVDATVELGRQYAALPPDDALRPVLRAAIESLVFPRLLLTPGDATLRSAPGTGANS